MRLLEFISQLRNNRAEGYEVILNIAGNQFKDYLVFASDDTRYPFFVYSGGISDNIETVLKTLTKKDVEELLGKEFYQYTVPEYIHATKGEVSGRRQSMGIRTPIEYNGVQLAGDAGLLKYKPLYALQFMTKVDALLGYYNREVKVENGKLYIPMRLTFPYHNQKVENALNDIPYNKDGEITIKAQGATVEHNGVRLQITSNIKMSQQSRILEEYAVKKPTYKTTVEFDALIEIDSTLNYNEDKSIENLFAKILGMCKQQVILDNKSKKLTYSEVEVKLIMEDRLITVYGLLVEEYKIVLCPHYRNIDLKTKKIESMEYLDEYAMTDEEYETYGILIKQMENIPYHEISLYCQYPEFVGVALKKRLVEFAKAQGMNTNTGVYREKLEPQTQLRYHNSFFSEDVNYLHYHNELAVKFGSLLDDRYIARHGGELNIQIKFQESVNRKIDKLLQDDEGLSISLAEVKLVCHDGRHYISCLLKWEYDKEYCYVDTKINNIVTEVEKTIKQKMYNL